MEHDIKLHLDIIGGIRFHIHLSWRGILFLWEADTSAPNLVWMKSIAVWLNWPPVQWETAYYPKLGTMTGIISKKTEPLRR